MRQVFVPILVVLGVLSFRTVPVAAQGFSPDEAASRMSLAEGLEAKLVAAEPMVRQPVAIEFDDRGRLWVIQYLQYPNPEGLQRVRVDRYSRTIYDRKPESPPRGPRGNDRITILEDLDGDGRADRARDFVTGLNLASGLAFGRDGVYVLQAPYLLFYPDQDRNDVPDGDPEVLLEGFGMEDAHSVANSLTWGPDGWLYGLQGSTVTARIRGIEFQQGVWRYHPERKRFELFADGGGNMWGLDFDRRGDLFASTNVGGFVMVHAVQGGSYWKSFGKHGPLHNPYTFGYFDHVPHEGVRGGHVSVGGLFYEADAFPAGWRGRYVAADLLHHAIRWHLVSPLGSSYRAIQGGDVLRANDTWFAPSDMTLGPDGAVYVADWHDRRTAHPDPDADWDRTNGRIYAIRAKGAQAVSSKLDLRTLSTPALVDRLGHPNAWHVRRARRLLTERHDPAALTPLRAAILDCGGQIPCLEALWALHGCGGLNTEFVRDILIHPDPELRAWTVRLVGDDEPVAPDILARLVEMAANEPQVRVRAQLAATAARLTGQTGREIAYRLLLRDLDADDPHLPLRLWWAVERHATADPKDVSRMFAAPAAWQSALVRDMIQPRLIRRFAAEKNASGDEACVRLLTSAPSNVDRQTLLAALDEATRGRRRDEFGLELLRAIKESLGADAPNPSVTRLAARVGDSAAIARAVAIARDRQALENERLTMIDLLGELSDHGAVLDSLLDVATGLASDAIQAAALRALGSFDQDKVPMNLLKTYPSKGETWRRRVQDVLLGRPRWARALLNEVEQGRISAAEIPFEQVRRVAALGDPQLDALVRKYWGMLTPATSEAKLAEVRRLNNDLRAGSGDVDRGRALFREHCAGCHRLFGEGRNVGPDLTHANRRDREFLLVSLVDPTGVIRKEYGTTLVRTHDGRVLSGLIAERSPTQVTLLGPNEERTTVRRDEIEVLKDSPISLMPEDLYRRFEPAALRDLFRFLESDPPQPAP